MPINDCMVALCYLLSLICPWFVLFFWQEQWLIHFTYPAIHCRLLYLLLVTDDPSTVNSLGKVLRFPLSILNMCLTTASVVVRLHLQHSTGSLIQSDWQKCFVSHSVMFNNHGILANKLCHESKGNYGNTRHEVGTHSRWAVSQLQSFVVSWTYLMIGEICPGIEFGLSGD